MPEIPPGAHALLEDPNFAFVGTVRPDGAPQVNPVWVDVDGDTVVLNTARGRAWDRFTDRDPRITVTVAEHDNPYHYVMVRGRVTEKTTDGADAHIDSLAKKYMGVDEYPLRQPGEERVILRVEPEHVHYNPPR